MTRYQHFFLEKKIYNNYNTLLLNYIDHTKNIICIAKNLNTSSKTEKHLKMLLKQLQLNR